MHMEMEMEMEMEAVVSAAHVFMYYRYYKRPHRGPDVQPHTVNMYIMSFPYTVCFTWTV